MCLLIVGKLNGQLSIVIKIVMDCGVKVVYVEFIEMVFDVL